MIHFHPQKLSVFNRSFDWNQIYSVLFSDSVTVTLCFFLILAFASLYLNLPINTFIAFLSHFLVFLIFSSNFLLASAPFVMFTNFCSRFHREPTHWSRYWLIICISLINHYFYSKVFMFTVYCICSF